MERGDSSTPISTARQDKRKPESPFDGITPQASASSSAVRKKRAWDVFINHRGCDTKHKLASTIYHTLNLIGLRAFLDVEELELGDSIPQEIQEAMRTAGLHIAIFSKRYAESPWCLAELSYMLQTGTPIIPVFYHVDLTDLRWVAQGKGCYAHAFSEHEEKGRYPSSMLNEWKTALERVSNLSGHVLNSNTGDEGMLLKSIVNSVSRVLKKEPLEVAKHPVGMDKIVEDFERSRGKCNQSEEHVQIVGIVGFGGSGKTTLATELYNRKSSSFHHSSCLYDVRDAASKNDLQTKQMKLLGDLRIQSVTTFDNAREGKGIVADRLKGLRVLIVLDDVDHDDQLDALLPPKESLGSGSLVIVTTREGDVLTKWGITSIYKMKPLQHLHARKLFCWHAFLQPFPQQGLEDLVEKFLDVCNGLPLSLKVIGGQLYGKRSRDYWVSQIEKFQKILPKEIVQRLKVSYDALDDDEKEMFLDVACFFIGKRSSAIAVWGGSGWSGLCSWETLQNKCLVEVDEEEYIRMHDHLRDLGRFIARIHSPSRLEGQSMLIQPGTQIRGIMAATDFHRGYMGKMEQGVSSTARQDKSEPENVFHESVPQLSSSSSSTILIKRPWDVFINHRGCDTKRNLASSIYRTLHLVRLRAFLDVEEMELGDSLPHEIQEAMRTAGLHIVIFSKNYAQSAWCLAELSLMLKTGVPILPVFYDVKPDDLRWVEQGCYAQAFSQHEKDRYSSKKLEEWKRALQEVSYCSGYILDSSNEEGKVLKRIVNSVLEKMKKVPLEVAKHPIAMDEIVEDFESSRGKSIQGEQHVQIVGIVGFGGSGKTTLATEFYNSKSSSFDRSSFVHDVRDAASKNALHTKQKKLLEDLRIQTASFGHVKEGKKILQKNLISHRVLIVLDDVDDENQLDALLPPKESLRSGSLVIVTTRERDVLTSLGITYIHKMQPLQDLYARRLFCWHAFLQPSPQQGFEDLVEDCLDACNGLPLSLKVIGGQLNGNRSKDYWDSQIEKIQRILPGNIMEMLRVSYDALDEDEKEIFLDVACFFIGERRSSAIAVWDGSGWSGLQYWETLHNKCLVEVDEEERIKMHDHLRDLGREIAKTHSPSRIWSQRQSMHIQRGMPIRGITDTEPPPFKEYMEMMRISNLRLGLQLLTVKENNFTQEFEELSSGLLWLRWLNFKHGYIPSWLSLQNVRVLELLQPLQLEALWDDTQPPLQLRELLIKNVPKLQSLPRSIGHLKQLKRLSLDCDFKGLRLPEEFCQLYSLEHLVLRECHKLSSLPNHFGDLVNLRHIDLSENWSLEMLPVSFNQLIQLEYLNLSGCHNLTLESNTLEYITNLKVFDVPFCNKLEVLPHNITNQASLEKLDLRYTMNLKELPASIDQLNKLTKLEIVWCRILTRLPISFGNLTSLSTLTLDGCPELCEMPSLAGLVSLNNLGVKDCDKIKKIEGLEHLMSLENLLLWTCWMEPGIRSLGGTERLRTLNLQADNISAFEPCIQSIEIENWPWEMTISARVPPNVQSILHSFTFPGVTVVGSLEVDRSNLEIERWSLTCRGTNLANAAMVCFLVRSVRSFAGDSSLVIKEGESTRIEVGEGEWIVISVFREVSSLIKEGGRSLQASIDVQQDFPYLNLDVLGGKLIVGDRGHVAEAFKQLFHITGLRS